MEIDQINVNSGMTEDSQQEDNIQNIEGTIRGGTTTMSSSSGHSMENISGPGIMEGGMGLIVETTTWSRDSHELFDYEAHHINNKKFLINKSSKIFRQNTECMILGDEDELPSQGDYLLSIKTTIDGKYIAFPADRSLGICNDKQLIPKKVWLIVRDLPNKSYSLQQNDLVKLGRFKLRVKQLVRSGDQVPELRLDETEANIIEPTLDESLTMQCRICLTEGEQEDDPLLCPCQCRGSIKFVHLECLRHWINGRLNLTNENGTRDTFFFRQLQCELCKSPLPSSASIKGSRVNIVNLPKTKPPFIVLENIYGNVHRGVHVVSMAEKKDLKLGRGHESDVRISDVSISRYHATIRYRNENFMLEDHDSKFGTLVSVRRPQAIENNHNLSLQVGRTVVNLRLSDEPCSPNIGIKELPVDPSKYQNNEQDDFSIGNGVNTANNGNNADSFNGNGMPSISEREGNMTLVNNLDIAVGMHGEGALNENFAVNLNNVASFSDTSVRISGNGRFMINAIKIGGLHDFSNRNLLQVGSSDYGGTANSVSNGCHLACNNNFGLSTSIQRIENVDNVPYGKQELTSVNLYSANRGVGEVINHSNAINCVDTAFNMNYNLSIGICGTNNSTNTQGTGFFSPLKTESTQKNSVIGKDFLDARIMNDIYNAPSTDKYKQNNLRCSQSFISTNVFGTNNHRNRAQCTGDNNTIYDTTHINANRDGFSCSSSSVILNNYSHYEPSRGNEGCVQSTNMAKSISGATYEPNDFINGLFELKGEGGFVTPPVSDSGHFLSCFPEINSLKNTSERPEIISNSASIFSNDYSTSTLSLPKVTANISNYNSSFTSSGMKSSSSSSSATSSCLTKGVSTSFNFPFISSSKSGNSSV